MITPEQKQLLTDMKNTNYGRALMSFLKERYESVGDINNCESLEDMIGRRYALKILREIFSFLDEEKVPKREKNIYV